MHAYLFAIFIISLNFPLLVVEMLSYLQWALNGFRSASTDDPPSLLEADSCQHDLRTISAEEQDIEDNMRTCLRALRRARAQRERLSEGYESLLMSTHDAFEHPVLARVMGCDGPMFRAHASSLERIRTEVDVDSEDLSDADPSDYSDPDIASALRLRGRGIAAVAVAPPLEEAAFEEERPKRTQFALVLSSLTRDDFPDEAEFSQWSEFYPLWRTRTALESKETRYDVLGRVEEECDGLDDRLFDLRIRLSSVKAKKKRADFQLEAYQDTLVQYEAPMSDFTLTNQTLSEGSHGAGDHV